MTLDRYLDDWFALQRTRIEPTSWHNYATMARIYLRPALGERLLAELTTHDRDLHDVHLLEGGGRYGRPLARRTAAYTHAILHKALGDAVAAGLLATNVAELAPVPRIDPRFDDAPRRLPTWDRDQVTHLRHARDRELHDVWRVALRTGTRRGELLGLRWENFDLEVPQLRVAASLTAADGRLRLRGTKTRRIRTLHLDDDTAAVLERQPRRAPTPYPVVFTRPDGSPWRPEVVTERWRRGAEAGAARHPAARSAPHPRDPAAPGRGAHQGRLGTARAQQGGHDVGRPRPRPARDGPSGQAADTVGRLLQWGAADRGPTCRGRRRGRHRPATRPTLVHSLV